MFWVQRPRGRNYSLYLIHLPIWTQQIEFSKKKKHDRLTILTEREQTAPRVHVGTRCALSPPARSLCDSVEGFGIDLRNQPSPSRPETCPNWSKSSS